MIRQDRELLARLSSVNTRLGEAVVELLHRQDGGLLPAEGLRALGHHLQGITADLLNRADELDAVVIDRPPSREVTSRWPPTATGGESMNTVPTSPEPDDELALRYLRQAESAAGTAPDAEPRDVGRIGVVGAGTMGAGIATVFLQAGFPVTVVEQSVEALERGVERISAIQDKAVARGKADRAEADRRLAALTAGTDQASLGDCDVVVEAVFEDMEVKKALLSRLATIVKPGAVLASNTSYLDLDELAEASGRPRDVVGLHFFSPAHVMRLLEVVRGAKTGEDTLATALWLGRKTGKLPVVAGVCDGFIGNRVYNAYRVQCEFMVEEGALPEEIDAALEGFGFAMGPFTVWDMSGLDIAKATRQRQAATRDPRERMPKVLDVLYERGRLGRKTGAGWYAYPDDGERQVDPAVHEVIRAVVERNGVEPRTLSPDEIVRRALGVIVNEAMLVLADGIAERASDIDLVLANGYGFPKKRGGPLFWAHDHRDQVTTGIDEAERATGFGFRRGRLPW
ncbi:3-hydroxyacyl-CoA dehydrogenase [Prauserella marina]|uniref:3-hydroxyacyl-CoA dehydrogenase n=1 Tax=Prauserella marina TaxID=530584 RepID=A0A1G6LSG3_9PSEU|nr:3-hydroxyacyl-CoA dehydrogenase [Prauserella marina]PWV85763.1 3-hydroxyacyl-CoA dehydrogenase [Prauserella marina]SDC46190.1 3-hydroxyacyl-CoA dehydrogenase [Prauserella marina]